VVKDNGGLSDDTVIVQNALHHLGVRTPLVGAAYLMKDGVGRFTVVGIVGTADD
jgi:hypothetical protein